jgi:dethiobiotin synthetase
MCAEASSAPPATREEPERLPGVVITSVTPGRMTAICGAAVIALAIQDGANVAAMVPVECGVDEPCEQGSTGALIRWAAGHLDDPRLVTPFAFGASLPTQHAAESDNLLPHPAALDRAYAALAEGRSAFVMCDAIGLLDPILPSLSTATLAARWGLSVVLAIEESPASLHHALLLRSACLAVNCIIDGAILVQSGTSKLEESDGERVRDSIAALLRCPSIRLAPILDAHDRTELLSAADASQLRSITRQSLTPRST